MFNVCIEQMHAFLQQSAINDYTCDIDVPVDIEKFRNIELD